eukprot:931372-Amphidinium_carterae.1
MESKRMPFPCGVCWRRLRARRFRRGRAGVGRQNVSRDGRYDLVAEGFVPYVSGLDDMLYPEAVSIFQHFLSTYGVTLKPCASQICPKAASIL